MAAALSGDGKLVVTAAGKAVSLWEVPTGRLRHRLWHEAEIRSAGFDSKGETVLTAGGGYVRVWNAATGRQVWMAQHSRRLFSARFAGDDKRVLAFAYNSVDELREKHPDPSARLAASAGRALVWDTASGRLVGDHPVNIGPDEFSPTATFHPAALGPDGDTLVLRAVDGIEVVNIASDKVQAIRHTDCNEPWLH